MSIRRPEVLAASWGLAEATVFFVVPDVLLSWLALQNLKRALAACLFALAGALVGGAIIWTLGQGDIDGMRQLFASIPAIDSEMISDVEAQIRDDGLWAVFSGPLQGVPYKIYALEASSLGYGLGIFLLISIPARLLRFLIVTLLIAGLARMFRDRISLRSLRIALVLAWIAFYAWYFTVMTGTA